MDAWLTLLGQFSLAGDAGFIPVDPSSSRMMAALALCGPTSREELADLLWPGTERDRGLANVRTVLWRMSAAVRRLVVGSPAGMSLHPALDVDVRRMGVSQRRTEAPPVEIGFRFSLDQLCAPLLTGWYDEWVLVERDRVRARQIMLLECRVSSHLERGDVAAAVIDATWAVTVDPLNETAHQMLLRSHLAEGNVSEAVRHYLHLTGLLENELGVSPNPGTVELMESCLR